MSTTLVLPVDVVSFDRKILPADTTTLLDLIDNTAGTKTMRIEALDLNSDDTSAKVVQFYRKTGASDAVLLGSVNVPTLSGTNGVAATVNALNTLGRDAPDGLSVFYCTAGTKLQIAVTVAVTAAKTIHVSGVARTYE